ncbi:hypothetical protein NQ317_016874 [Molorchus minor]|uniref:VTT domain-containing protein n=1 Tax=Molorchus minor TaxID=1323400 RepID=A0ABQ9J846_9CUCU|nr:hypothetical protein NQ317_016874 [Molorchus minor]
MMSPVCLFKHPNPNFQLSENGQTIRTETVSTKFATIAVGTIFLSSLLALFLVYNTFPNVTPDERQYIKLPWNIQEAKQLGIILNRYKSDNYYQVMAGVFTSYILKKYDVPSNICHSRITVSLDIGRISVSIFCSLIISMYMFYAGSITMFSTVSAIRKKIGAKIFPEKAQSWAVQVNKHKDNLFNYMVFLRVTPFLPNWFINLTAPVIGVPLYPFAFGTFIGVAPPSFIAIQGGQTLQNMTENDSAFSVTSFIWLAIFGLIALIPIFLKNRLKEKIE